MQDYWRDMYKGANVLKWVCILGVIVNGFGIFATGLLVFLLPALTSLAGARYFEHQRTEAIVELVKHELLRP